MTINNMILSSEVSNEVSHEVSHEEANEEVNDTSNENDKITYHKCITKYLNNDIQDSVLIQNNDITTNSNNELSTIDSPIDIMDEIKKDKEAIKEKRKKLHIIRMRQYYENMSPEKKEIKKQKTIQRTRAKQEVVRPRGRPKLTEEQIEERKASKKCVGRPKKY